MLVPRITPLSVFIPIMTPTCKDGEGEREIELDGERLMLGESEILVEGLTDEEGEGDGDGLREIELEGERDGELEIERLGLLEGDDDMDVDIERDTELENDDERLREGEEEIEVEGLALDDGESEGEDETLLEGDDEIEDETEELVETPGAARKVATLMACGSPFVLVHII